MRKKLPRYTTKYTDADGLVRWSYSPPKRAIKAGAVTKLDLEASTYSTKKLINDMNRRLDEWRKSVISQQ